MLSIGRRSWLPYAALLVLLSGCTTKVIVVTASPTSTPTMSAAQREYLQAVATLAARPSDTPVLPTDTPVPTDTAVPPPPAPSIVVKAPPADTPVPPPPPPTPPPPPASAPPVSLVNQFLACLDNWDHAQYLAVQIALDRGLGLDPVYDQQQLNAWLPRLAGCTGLGAKLASFPVHAVDCGYARQRASRVEVDVAIANASGVTAVYYQQELGELAAYIAGAC